MAVLTIEYNQRHKQTQHHQKTFSKFCNSMQIASATKHKIPLSIENAQANVITI